ncbi:alpha/beta hydrolase [Rhizobium sp. VS19-DR104.2]|uniref:alpha/beta fold hydrolase n=1 Tax=unclassified Rhizobium TaxID=2613769 RepID=UPI001CC6BA71|nr:MULTISPECIES: alpha/beta hydrolase [unclassified Rhizobium]MBZ5762233.1 alpha/beta hydrolase [Rhizobium sp. VS19-DR96]MBZ5768249.1 alpha/beta hydrolase [Rhizobium sp. VS19-DR129.2]MBZ5775879.1 alpha/beta hydrolase [Rhizobium sp. VS19-DRK62.2]MBZ5787100.1 alpha/beta hydrolase [Rhizobium sp. VS19-DR121]MBZ5804174.1 alpha/beta hydrolase [Rhizobium sp. VS19-DR181]
MIATKDGVSLYAETTGNGVPVVFIHEFAGDHRSWEPQVRHLSRMHRCVTFASRGYFPSDVPTVGSSYSQDLARTDVIAVMDHYGIEKAHVVGHSMGAYTALHVGLRHPERCLSVAALGCGWGSNPADREASAKACTDIAKMFEEKPMNEAAAIYARAPMRLTFEAKDPRGFAEFEEMLAEHSGLGSALTMLNLQMLRPTLWELQKELAEFVPPLLVMVGDEDFPCIDGSLFLKRTVPTAGLYVVPRAGHTITSEEPAIVNSALVELFACAEAGTWMAHRAKKAV